MNEVWPSPEKGEAPVVNLIPGVIKRPSKPNNQLCFFSILVLFYFFLFNKPAREACISFSFMIAYFYLQVGPKPRKGIGTSMYVCVWEHTYISGEVSQGLTREGCTTLWVCVENVYKHRTCIKRLIPKAHATYVRYVRGQPTIFFKPIWLDVFFYQTTEQPMSIKGST